MAIFGKKKGNAVATAQGTMATTLPTAHNMTTLAGISPSSWWGTVPSSITTSTPILGGVSSGSTTTWTNWHTQAGYQYTPHILESSVSFDLEGDVDACLAKLEGVDFVALAMLLGKPSILRYSDYSEVYFSVSCIPAKQWTKVDKYLTSSGIKTLNILIRLGAEIVDEKTLKVTFVSSKFDGEAGKYIVKYTTKT